MTFSKFLKYWLPVLLWMGFTFLMSTGAFTSENTSRIIAPILRFLFPSISLHQLQLAHEVVRKMAHLTEYFILSLVLFRAFRSDSTEDHAWRWAVSSILVLALFAASDELHQTFVAGRTPSVIDVGIDTVGGFIAQCVSVVRYRQRRNHPQRIG